MLPTSVKQESQGRYDRHLLVGHLGRQDLPVLAIKRLHKSMPRLWRGLRTVGQGGFCLSFPLGGVRALMERRRHSRLVLYPNLGAITNASRSCNTSMNGCHCSSLMPFRHPALPGRLGICCTLFAPQGVGRAAKEVQVFK